MRQSWEWTHVDALGHDVCVCVRERERESVCVGVTHGDALGHDGLAVSGAEWAVHDVVPAPDYLPIFKNNCFTELGSGSKAGSYLRRIDFCITQL